MFHPIFSHFLLKTWASLNPPGLGHTCLHLFWLQAQAEACETGAALQRGGAGWKFIYKNYSIQLHLMFCCHCCLVSGRSLNLHESTKRFNINGEQTSPNTNSDFLVSKIRGSHQHLQLLQWSIICNSGPGEILSRSKSMIWWVSARPKIWWDYFASHQPASRIYQCLKCPQDWGSLSSGTCRCDLEYPVAQYPAVFKKLH